MQSAYFTASVDKANECLEVYYYILLKILAKTLVQLLHVFIQYEERISLKQLNEKKDIF